MRRRLAAALFSIAGALPAAADDNAVAFRLFEEGRYAEAAEIFNDPAWKGAAFYKSEQWWRAAEAFVRSSDADSIYNLGNCYARLGYHALALEAYLAALSIDPANADAKANADIMREILAREQNNNGEAALQPKAREIERVEGKPEEKGGSPAESGDKKASPSNSGAGEPQQSSGESKQSGNRGQGGENDGTQEQNTASQDARSRIDGSAGEAGEARESAGRSQAANETSADDAAGQRIALEKSQATTQWLNAIPDDPGRFLESRIALEMRRRAAAGTLPQGSRDPW